MDPVKIFWEIMILVFKRIALRDTRPERHKSSVQGLPLPFIWELLVNQKWEKLVWQQKWNCSPKYFWFYNGQKQNLPASMTFYYHGLRTTNEGINQRNLKIWVDVADKIRPYLKIWVWELIFGHAVKAISSLGVHSPCLLLLTIAPHIFLNTTPAKYEFSLKFLSFEKLKFFLRIHFCRNKVRK